MTNPTDKNQLTSFAPPSGGEGPRVITFASGKGGVGKTHMSVNIGVALAQKGQRVLLLDADLGLANVNVLLGISPPYHAGHLLDGSQPFENVVSEVSENLHILPAGTSLAHLTELDTAAQVHLLARLDLYRRPYDFVLIDAAAGIGGNVRLALSMAHQILVVMNPEMTSLTDAYALVKVGTNDGCAGPFQVIVNRVRIAEQGREMFSSLNSAAVSLLKTELEFAGYVYMDPVVEKALRSQRPFIESYPDAPAARCVNSLAEYLLDQVPSQSLQSPSNVG